MKHLFFLLLSATVLFTSCGKDDNCNADSLESVVVGNWSVTVLGIVAGDVEFKSDGSLVDQDEVLLDGNIGDELSYTVNSNTSLTLRAEDAGTFTEDIYTVTQFDCDEIKVDTGGGFIATLKRK
ncbi:MAG: hypothetical protein M3R25_10370 [Bacteroidota bacterium]|nr:hypothetical protein [Bacteroidota bacterium]